jgi:type IV pilus assembly protein PilW
MMNPNSYFSQKQLGVTLIELMVAVAIGAFLMLGLTTTFRNSSEAQRALAKSSQLIENGRYAINIINEDLQHAGFYGEFYDLAAAPTDIPDPCETTDMTRLTAGMSVPVQTYTAANFSTPVVISSTPTTTCTSLLTSDNLKAGSDILVVRRAETAVFTGNPNTGEVYMQANPRSANLLTGVSSQDVPPPGATRLAPLTAADASTENLMKYPSKGDASVPAAIRDEIADTRKYKVHVYFVSTCNFGDTTVDGSKVCTAAQRTDPDAVPTLKRLELTTGGSNPRMEIVPLVEGIEYMKLEYGLDNSPTTVNPVTGQQGDGVPDTYVTTPSQAQWPTVVSIKVHLLARSPEKTKDYSDPKVYTIAGANFTPRASGFAVDGINELVFKRHVFSTEVRPMNLSGRREIPE